MPQLDISTYGSQIFWLVVSLSFLVCILHVSIVPRYLKILKTRAKNINRQLNDAQDAEAAANARVQEIALLKEKSQRTLRKLIASERHALSEENTHARETIFSHERKRLRFDLQRIADIDATFTTKRGDLCKEVTKGILTTWGKSHD